MVKLRIKCPHGNVSHFHMPCDCLLYVGINEEDGTRVDNKFVPARFGGADKMALSLIAHEYEFSYDYTNAECRFTVRASDEEIEGFLSWLKSECSDISFEVFG